MTERRLATNARESESTPNAKSSLADEIIDELVPAEVDWKAVVTSYPKLSVSLVAVAGFWLGRTHGRKIVSGITGLAAETVNESINEFFGRDVV